MDLKIFKKILHVNKDISRITIDLYSIKKLLSSDLSIMKILNEYQLEFDKMLDGSENYLSRFHDIIKEVENRQKKATPTYNLILEKRKEYLIKGYNDYYKNLENHISHRNSLKTEENINQVKKIVKGIDIEYNFKIDLNRIFLFEFVHRIFYPKHQLELLTLISSKMNTSVLSQITPNLDFNKIVVDKEEGKIFINKLNESFEIEQYQLDYDFCFMLSLRHTPNDKIEDFLKIHFDSFDGNFLNFLKSSCSYFGEFLNDNQRKRIEEWIKNCKVDSKKTTRIKNPRKERTKEDTLTSLNQEETAALFHYLKESKVILNDRTLQPKGEIAKAIFCLTGYSHNTVSDKLSDMKKEKNEETLKTTRNKLQQIIRLINSDLDSI